MKFWRLHRPGYRVLKTVIAATLTLLVCSRFSEMIVDFWMPNKTWPGCDVNDPSARVLSNYGASGE